VSDQQPPPQPPPPPRPPTPQGAQHTEAAPAFAPPTGLPVEVSAPLVRKVSGIGSAVVILSSVVGVAALLSAITQGGARQQARDFLSGQLSEDEFLEAYTSATAAGALASLGQVALAILTFMLMIKMARNLRDLGRSTTWGPIWGVVGWVLPPGVLYLFPWLMFRELWKASGPEEEWRSESVPWSFNLWWVAFGLAPIPLATILGVSVVNAGLMATDTRALATILAEQYWVTLASGIATAVAAGAYVVMIRALVSRHRTFTGEFSQGR
jgi:hypothetical protein